METKIVAKWQKGHLVEGESLPMCSVSERDDLFWEEGKWVYELPDNYRMFKNPSQTWKSIPVIGVKDGTETLLGYACEVRFVLMGVIFETWEDCLNSPMFHPLHYEICRVEDAERVSKRQIEAINEDEWFGD